MTTNKRFFLGSVALFALVSGATQGTAQAQATLVPAPNVTVAAPTAIAPAAAPAGGTATTIKAGTSVTAAGPATVTSSASGTKVTTTNAGDKATTTTQEAPNGVEVEIGIVSRLNGAISAYQSNNGQLSLTSLGRATPQLLTGLGFSCDTSATTTTTSSSSETTLSSAKNSDDNAFCNSRIRHFGAYVSAQIGTGGSPTLSGYSVGLTYALSKQLRLLAGFSLTPTNEISPGFANAAAQYVGRNPALFPGVNPASLSSNSYGAFDGIQFTATAPAAGAVPTSTIYYPGATTETHYRGGFIIGVALPINIFNLLGGNNKSQ